MRGNVLQEYLLLWRREVVSRLIIDNYYLINSVTNDIYLLISLLVEFFKMYLIELVDIKWIPKNPN